MRGPTRESAHGVDTAGRHNVRTWEEKEEWPCRSPFRNIWAGLKGKTVGRSGHRGVQYAAYQDAAALRSPGHRLRPEPPGGLRRSGRGVGEPGRRAASGARLSQGSGPRCHFPHARNASGCAELLLVQAKGSVITSEMEVFSRSAPATPSPSPAATEKPLPPPSSPTCSGRRAIIPSSGGTSESPCSQMWTAWSRMTTPFWSSPPSSS